MFKDYLKIIPLLALGLSSPAWADVNIAVIAPMAGEYQIAGSELISGVKIAVDEINDQGGLQGERINLLTVDDQCDNRIAVSTAQMMAVTVSPKDKMALVIGPYCQNAFNRIADIYAKAGIFQIIPTAVSSGEASQNHKGLVKMVGYKEHQASDFFNFYQQRFPDQKVAIIYDTHNRDIVEIAAAVQKEFQTAGKSSYLSAFNFAAYDDDYDKIAEDVIKGGSKIAYILGKSKRAVRLAKSLKDEDQGVVIFINKYQSQRYNKEMGKLAEGTYVLALPSLKDSPEFAETLVKLRLLGVEPEGLSVYGYSAVQLWSELVSKADSFKYDKLARSLENNKFESGWGEVMFNNGNPQNSINYGIYQLRGGEYTQVY